MNIGNRFPGLSPPVWKLIVVEYKMKTWKQEFLVIHTTTITQTNTLEEKYNYQVNSIVQITSTDPPGEFEQAKHCYITSKLSCSEQTKLKIPYFRPDTCGALPAVSQFTGHIRKITFGQPKVTQG